MDGCSPQQAFPELEATCEGFVLVPAIPGELELIDQPAEDAGAKAKALICSERLVSPTGRASAGLKAAFALIGRSRRTRMPLVVGFSLLAICICAFAPIGSPARASIAELSDGIEVNPLCGDSTLDGIDEFEDDTAWIDPTADITISYGLAAALEAAIATSDALHASKRALYTQLDDAEYRNHVLERKLKLAEEETSPARVLRPHSLPPNHGSRTGALARASCDLGEGHGAR